MQKRIFFILSVIAVVLMSIGISLAAEVQSSIEFKDGTIIKGQIQNEALTVKTSFGMLKPPTEKIAFISEGNVELRDGSKIMGDIVVDEDGLVVKTKYGTWTLHFGPEDLQMITFSR
jgi:preprotein translocase subunit SecF